MKKLIMRSIIRSIILSIIFLVIQVILSVKVVVYDNLLSNIEEKITSLEEENISIEAKLASYTSCNKVYEEKTEKEFFKIFSFANKSQEPFFFALKLEK